MFIVPVTGCMFAGWRKIHASAMVVFATWYLAASSSIFAFSFGNFSLLRNTPSKNPYWNGDHGCTVMSPSRQKSSTLPSRSTELSSSMFTWMPAEIMVAFVMLNCS